jgi:hypothetical protein
VLLKRGGVKTKVEDAHLDSNLHEKKLITNSNWWRWIAMPFGSVIGAVTGSFVSTGIMIFIFDLADFKKNGWHYHFVLPIISGASLGYLWSTIACSIAPKGKVVTGSVMTSVLGMILLIIIIATWDRQTGTQIAPLLIESTAAMITAILAVVEEAQKNVRQFD